MTAAGATIGKSLLYGGTEDACYAGYLVRFRPKSSVDGRFVAYWMESSHYWDQIATGKVVSTIENFSAGKYQNISCPTPPTSVQRAIADYLDAETARIDALIAKKQRMIELLDERFRAACEDLLLAASDSQTPLRRLLIQSPDYGAAESGTEIFDGWPRYVRITDITAAGKLKAEDSLALPPEVARPYLLNDGDLLLARSGATVGRSLLYEETMGPAAFAGYLIRFRIDPNRLLPRLAFFWTRTNQYWLQVREASLQATIENVSAEKYKDFMIPLPEEMSSQRALVSRLSGLSETSAFATKGLARQIDLLREHRQALITAAVTGEIDIPEVAA
jgi:type I restriction enzyme S subunit